MRSHACLSGCTCVRTFQGYILFDIYSEHGSTPVLDLAACTMICNVLFTIFTACCHTAIWQPMYIVIARGHAHPCSSICGLCIESCGKCALQPSLSFSLTPIHAYLSDNNTPRIFMSNGNMIEDASLSHHPHFCSLYPAACCSQHARANCAFLHAPYILLTRHSHLRRPPSGLLWLQKLFPNYQLPNGKRAFFYYAAGRMVDEVAVPACDPPARPTSVPQALQQTMPLAQVMSVFNLLVATLSVRQASQHRLLHRASKTDDDPQAFQQTMSDV